MRWLPVLCYLGIAAWQVGANFDALFPNEPAKRAALHDCLTTNHRFNPLDKAARDGCYEARLRPSTPQPMQQGSMQQANFVDLWKAQGQGPISGNDMRRSSTIR